MPTGPVAVIDIGSNTIKLLVAIRANDGGVLPLKTAARDARISKGISGEQPRLSPAGIATGVEAVRELVQAAAPYGPQRTLIVATSAVRDAQNGAEFREQIHAATGCEVRVLTGDEEAALIGRGLTVDPGLRGQRDFYVFDLGGGSLECLAFRDRQIERAVSLPLGCVRLTERFIADPNAPFGHGSLEAIIRHTQKLLSDSSFAFELGNGALAIGTGGTMATARAIVGAKNGQSFEETKPLVEVRQLAELLTWLGALPLAERKRVPGLPPARADVFPAALTTLIAVAELGRFAAYHNSLYNLRYGVADEALSRPAGSDPDDHA